MGILMTESRDARTHRHSDKSSQAPNQLVTVVTPSFNQARFLEETIRSVALQSYRPIQHIVVDGGSTDGSVDILKRCAEALGNSGYVLDWISEPDRGLPDALGKGFAMARGAIVGWLNSDDVYFDRRVVESATEEFVENPDVDVVHGDVALISETSGLWMIWCFPRFDYKRALRGYIVPSPTAFFRRLVVEQHPIGSLRVVSVDHAYYLEIGSEHKFRHVHRVQAADRSHASRLSNTKSSQMREESTRYLETYGKGYVPTSLDQAYDVFTRLLMRFKGAAYLVRMFATRRLEDELAFPLWMDSRWKVLRRQFTMRLNDRPDIGSPPTFKPQRAADVLESSRERS
jgi:glycosyltransferase involved in cell wall biosynthesis